MKSVFVQVVYAGKDSTESFQVVGYYTDRSPYEFLTFDMEDKRINELLQSGFSFVGKKFQLIGVDNNKWEVILNEGLGSFTYWITNSTKKDWY